MMETQELLQFVRGLRAEMDTNVGWELEHNREDSQRFVYLSGMIDALDRVLAYFNARDTRLGDEMRRQQGQPS